MKNTMNMIALVAAFLMFAGCSGQSGKESKASEQENAAKEAMTVDALMENVDEYVNKQVQLKGVVEHVCEHGGKRLHLMDSSGEQKIRVESGAISQFERKLEGEQINVSGTLKKNVIDEAYLNRRAEELKKESTKHDHDQEGKGEHTEEKAGSGMVHQVNNMKQVKSLRKQLKEGDKEEIVMYWIEGKDYKKCAQK